MSETEIDITYDFRKDANNGDPDKESPTLRRYHKLLWSKLLPNGKLFKLSTDSALRYLYHNSEIGEFILSSDSVIQTFTHWKRYQHIIGQIPEADKCRFNYIGYTIGGMMVFPANRVNGRMTINGARGCNRKIDDRFDLTLECIRRFYSGEESPLYEDLLRYQDFVNLFANFKGYVDFFILQDLVKDDYSSVQFFSPFDDFRSPALPASVEDYRLFMDNTISFVQNRNARIAEYYR
jgi:hypothetical protein